MTFLPEENNATLASVRKRCIVTQLVRISICEIRNDIPFSDFVFDWKSEDPEF